jgi:hypothetical protein
MLLDGMKPDSNPVRNHVRNRRGEISVWWNPLLVRGSLIDSTRLDFDDKIGGDKIDVKVVRYCDPRRLDFKSWRATAIT